MEKEVYENVIGLNFTEKQKCGLGGGILSYLIDMINKTKEWNCVWLLKTKNVG